MVNAKSFLSGLRHGGATTEPIDRAQERLDYTENVNNIKPRSIPFGMESNLLGDNQVYHNNWSLGFSITFEATMVLDNVYISGKGPMCIKVEGGTIQALTSAGSVTPTAGAETRLQFENAIAFPGLINSHDHLDFNLFPLLGNRVYDNYVEWGLDIHAKNKKEINAVLNIPQTLRTQWGIYKNLLNGITTVVNHGATLPVDMPPVINVLQHCQSLHSVRLEKHWKYKLNNPLAMGKPPAIHLGEGTNHDARQEVNEYSRANIFKRKTTAVHGVAMDEAQAACFNALVWCPDSNYFLLNQTADVSALKHHTQMLFGTDSTLTASWNIWEQLKMAVALNKVTDEEIINMLTVTPAAVWGLPKHGYIANGMAADIVVAKQKTVAQIFFALNPEDILLVMQNGQVRLFDESLYGQLNRPGFSTAHFSRIIINGSRKYVEGNLPGLIQEIRTYHPTITLPIHA